MDQSLQRLFNSLDKILEAHNDPCTEDIYAGMAKVAHVADAIRKMEKVYEEYKETPNTVRWSPITEELPPAHQTVLAMSVDNDIYQARVCYGMHEPFWCGHSKLNFGVVLREKDIEITHWMKA